MATVQMGLPDRIKVTVLTSTANFVPDPRAVETLVQLQAAGGTSSGYNGGTAAAGSSGGGGGNYMEVLFTAPLTMASVAVTLGASTPGANATVINSANSTFGSFMTVAGGVRGWIYSTGGTEAQIGAPFAPVVSSVAFGAQAATIILDMPGGQGTGIMIPRAGDYGFIKGGDGGDSYWGRGGRSDAAIYSGGRGYASVQRDGSGYGWGGQGWAYGSIGNYGSHRGGPARCIITEYF
jgi:hypothetical protein